MTQLLTFLLLYDHPLL